MMQELPAMAASANSFSNYSAVDMLSSAGANQFRAQMDFSKLVMPNPPKEKNVSIQVASRRMVQVFITDPNENVPLADFVLHKGEVLVTDATDQELFFDVDIKGLLDAYNVKRVTFLDKKVKDRTEHLEPARVRDLKMTVVTLASF